MQFLTVEEQVAAGLLADDPEVPDKIRVMDAEQAVEYCLSRGWWLSPCTEFPDKFNYGIDHAEQVAILDALAEKKPDIIKVLKKRGDV